MTSVSTSLLWTHISNCLVESSTWLSHRYLKRATFTPAAPPGLHSRFSSLKSAPAWMTAPPPPLFCLFSLGPAPCHILPIPPPGVLLHLSTSRHATWSHCLLASISAKPDMFSRPPCTLTLQSTHPFSFPHDGHIKALQTLLSSNSVQHHLLKMFQWLFITLSINPLFTKLPYPPLMAHLSVLTP